MKRLRHKSLSHRIITEICEEMSEETSSRSVLKRLRTQRGPVVEMCSLCDKPQYVSGDGSHHCSENWCQICGYWHDEEIVH